MFYKKDDPDFLRLYPSYASEFHQLEEGIYQMRIWFNDSQYVAYDSIPVLADQLAYVKIKKAPLQLADSISRHIFSHATRIWHTEKEVERAKQEIKEYRNDAYHLTETFDSMEWIRGFVADEEGNPIQGANILLKGTTMGTFSGSSGEFELAVPNNGVLVIWCCFSPADGVFHDIQALRICLNGLSGT